MMPVENLPIPDLRFSEFKDNWTPRLLDNFAERGSGHTPSKSHPEYYGGDIDWISLADSKRLDNGYIEVTKTRIAQLGLQNSSAVLHPPETVILSRDAGVGKSAVMKHSMAVSQHFIVWRAIEEVSSPWFLYYWLQIMKPHFERIAIGSTIKTIGLPYFKKLQITAPTLPEQQKIAEFLTAVDGRIQQLIQKKTLLEEYKKGLMQQLFTQAIRFKDDDGNDFPDWEEKKLGDIYDYIVTNSLSRDKLNYESGEVFNIHYGDIHTKFKSHFYLSKERVPYLNDSAAKLRIKEECYLEKGDVVLADASEDYADIGKSIEILETQNRQIVAGLHTYILRPDLSKMAIGFGAYLMQARPTRLEVMTVAQGTKVLGLPKGYLSDITLKIPTVSEQTKIADFLSAIDSKIESASTQITETQTFKRGLLQQMFV
jgi:type I restriction enzyme S subunit